MRPGGVGGGHYCEKMTPLRMMGKKKENEKAVFQTLGFSVWSPSRDLPGLQLGPLMKVDNLSPIALKVLDFLHKYK